MSNSSARQQRIRTLFVVLLVTPGTLLAINEFLWGVVPAQGFSFGWLLIIWFLFSIILSFAFLFTRFRKNKLVAFLPIIINILLLFALFNLDIAAFSRNREFRKDLKDREEVVELIMSGKLKPHKEELDLPDRYKHLSRYGDGPGPVVVGAHKGQIELIVFFVRNVALGGHAGFAYIPEKHLSREVFGALLDKDDVVIKMKDHWYWIDH